MQAVGPSSLEGSLSGKEGGRRVRVREGDMRMIEAGPEGGYAAGGKMGKGP